MERRDGWGNAFKPQLQFNKVVNPSKSPPVQARGRLFTKEDLRRH
jgi:hypothetical protein